MSDMLAFILTIGGLGHWPMRVESSLLLGRALSPPPAAGGVQFFFVVVDSNAINTRVVVLSH